MFESGTPPSKIIEEKNWKQISDINTLEKYVDDVIAANPDKVEQARNKPQLIGWFIAQALKASKNQANPKIVSELFQKKLKP